MNINTYVYIVFPVSVSEKQLAVDSTEPWLRTDILYSGDIYSHAANSWTQASYWKCEQAHPVQQDSSSIAASAWLSRHRVSWGGSHANESPAPGLL